MMVCDATVILVATEPFTLVDAGVRVSLVDQGRACSFCYLRRSGFCQAEIF